MGQIDMENFVKYNTMTVHKTGPGCRQLFRGAHFACEIFFKALPTLGCQAHDTLCPKDSFLLLRISYSTVNVSN